jgi:N-methylhydantoinase B
VILRGTNVAELFASGRLPGPGELTGEREVLVAKSVVEWHPDDVVIGSLAGGGGFGDPIRREPAAVERDVELGLVTRVEAQRVYGVIEGDAAATAERRAAVRSERVTVVAPEPVAGETLYPISDCVEAVASREGARLIRCSACGQRLCAEGDDLLAALPTRERSLAEANPHNGGCLPDYVLRDWFCPGCATRLDCQVLARR